MKQELLDNDVEKVVGGTVIVSDMGVVGFDTTYEKFQLNVSWKEARNFVESLQEQHPTMSNAEFDAFCRDQMAAAGMLGPQL